MELGKQKLKKTRKKGKTVIHRCACISMWKWPELNRRLTIAPAHFLQVYPDYFFKKYCL